MVTCTAHSPISDSHPRGTAKSEVTPGHRKPQQGIRSGSAQHGISRASLDWLALRVKPRHEDAVARSLRNLRLEEFLPVCVGQGYLFPGFVFCRSNHRDQPGLLGIAGVLAIGGPSKSSIPDAEIARIKMILASRLPARPRAFLRTGQRVGVRRGSLAGMEGILLRCGCDFQVIVSIEALQRSFAAEINHEIVLALEGAVDAERATLFLTV